MTRSLSTRIKNYQDSDGLNGNKSASTTMGYPGGKGRKGEGRKGAGRRRKGGGDEERGGGGIPCFFFLEEKLPACC